mgnify:FL=1
MESIDGLKLPSKVGKNLYLASIKSANGVEFPNMVGGWIDLVGLKSIEGLKLPEHVEGGVDFRLGPSNMEILKKQYPNLILTSADWVKDQ